MISSQDFVLDLGREMQTAAVGGKAFTLHQIQKAGIPTPGGSVIPDQVFQTHLHNSGVASEVNRLFDCLASWSTVEISNASASIRTALENTGLDKKFRTPLKNFYQDHWQGKPVVVRSSAYGEDSTTASFAGQLDSFLNITSFAELEQAIKATWGSLYSLRVLLYQRDKNIRLEHMGVLIQPQVPARLSGVLFTRDPSGQRENAMLVEFCSGLGDALASGSITPDRARINREDLDVTVEQIQSGCAMLDAHAVDGIKKIAAMGLKLEDRYGMAQDVEWCIDTAGNPIIVQTRPATRLAPAKPGRNVHWSNANIAENFPEPVSPFLFSIVKQGYSAYFRNLGTGFGVARRRIDAMEDELNNIVGLQGGRLYYNLSNIHRLLHMLPFGHRLVEYFNLFVGASGTPPGAEKFQMGVLPRLFEITRIALSVILQYAFVKQRVRRFENRVDKFARATEPQLLGEKSLKALAEDIDGFLNIRLRQWNDAALADTAAMVCYGGLKAVLAGESSDREQASIHNDLLKGLPHLASTVPVVKLWELSRQIKDDSALADLFSNDAEVIAKDLTGPRFAEFENAFQEYLANWGFRSSGELMLTTPTPQEDPLPTLRLLRAYVRTGVQSPADVADKQQQERLKATRRVEERLSAGKWWRKLPLGPVHRFRIVLAMTQGAIKLRERARMKQALLYTRLRHIVLSVGDCLVENGVLQNRDDVFLLTSDELAQHIHKGAKISPDLVLARREELAGYKTYEPPDKLILADNEQWQPIETDPVGILSQATQKLSGTGACGGVVTGNAAVVLDVAESDSIQPEQILVTRQTDPGWATVFFLIKGLVIERGGMLSHGAIVAREYGIPAVVGVPNATRIIRPGDTLSVNGDQGVVEIHN